MSAEWFRHQLDKETGMSKQSGLLKTIPDAHITLNNIHYIFAHENSKEWDEMILKSSTCQNFLLHNNSFVGSLYDEYGKRYTYIVYNCSNGAYCCGFGCCPKHSFLILFALITLSAFIVFLTLRFAAKLCCKKMQRFWRKRQKKTSEVEDEDRVNYIGNMHLHISPINTSDMLPKLHARPSALEVQCMQNDQESISKRNSATSTDDETNTVELSKNRERSVSKNTHSHV